MGASDCPFQRVTATARTRVATRFTRTRKTEAVNNLPFGPKGVVIIRSWWRQREQEEKGRFCQWAVGCDEGEGAAGGEGRNG